MTQKGQAAYRARVNPFSIVSWLWKAWRGQSVTFAVLFGSALLGLSMMSAVKRALAELEMNWLGMLIFPMLLTALLIKAEHRWLRDPELRRRLSRRIVLGAVGLGALLWMTGLGREKTPESAQAPAADAATQPAAPAEPVKAAPASGHRGPSGK